MRRLTSTSHPPQPLLSPAGRGGATGPGRLGGIHAAPTTAGSHYHHLLPTNSPTNHQSTNPPPNRLTAISSRKGCGHWARVDSSDSRTRRQLAGPSSATCQAMLRAKPCCACRWEGEAAVPQVGSCAAHQSRESSPLTRLQHAQHTMLRIVLYRPTHYVQLFGTLAAPPTCSGPSMANWGKHTGTPPRIALGGANTAFGDTKISRSPPTFQEVRVAPCR